MSELRAFTMPKWGIEMTEGVLVEWAVDEGQAFEKGQLLASVETEKIVNEIEADYAAVCLKRVADEGETLGVGELLAVFGEAGADAAAVERFVADFEAADTAFSGEDGAADATTGSEATVPALGTDPQDWFSGFGNGGQRLFIMPSIATTCVIFAGNYNALDAWVSPMRIWREIVIANVAEA